MTNKYLEKIASWDLEKEALVTGFRDNKEGLKNAIMMDPKATRSDVAKNFSEMRANAKGKNVKLGKGFGEMAHGLAIRDALRKGLTRKI